MGVVSEKLLQLLGLLPRVKMVPVLIKQEEADAIEFGRIVKKQEEERKRYNDDETVKALLSMDDQARKETICILEERDKRNRAKRDLSHIKELNDYVGNCYKITTTDATHYLRIVSGRGRREGYAYGITFATPIQFSQKTEIRKAGNDWPYSSIEFDGLNICDVSKRELDREQGIDDCGYYGWQQIDEEEFLAGYDNFTAQMKSAMLCGVFDTGANLLQRYEETIKGTNNI